MREKDGEREFSSLESLYVSRIGNKEKENNISDLIDCFLNAIHCQSLSLFLSFSLCACVCACVFELCKNVIVLSH